MTQRNVGGSPQRKRILSPVFAPAERQICRTAVEVASLLLAARKGGPLMFDSWKYPRHAVAVALLGAVASLGCRGAIGEVEGDTSSSPPGSPGDPSGSGGPPGS